MARGLGVKVLDVGQREEEGLLRSLLLGGFGGKQDLHYLCSANGKRPGGGIGRRARFRCECSKDVQVRFLSRAHL